MTIALNLLLGIALTGAVGPEERSRAAAMSINNLRSPLPIAILQGKNSVSGHVFGDARQPLGDVHVELQNELGVTVTRMRTNGSGRYVFFGLPDGRYKVRVMPYDENYHEQSQDVTLIPVSAIPGSGAENAQVDFYLRPREAANAGPLASPGTIFVQEVPDPAKKLYETGIAELKAKREKEGFQNLRMALEIFPNYFAALDRLGTEYAVRGNQDKRYFEAARILLTKAVEVNRKSFSSTFGLGFAQYHLGLLDPAIVNLQRATTIQNKMINGHMWLGIAYKRAGRLAEAEAALKRADEMSKGKESEVHWNLAKVYSEQKRYLEAADELEKFLNTKPDARDAEKIRELIAQLRKKTPSP